MTIHVYPTSDDSVAGIAPAGRPLMAVSGVSVSPWIRSFKWDGFWILSGFWIPTLFLCLPLQSSKYLIFSLTLCFWIGHRISSTYLAFCVGEYRQVIRAKPVYFLVFPACLFCLLMAFVLCPESLLPIPRLWRFFALGFLDYFLSLYHFSVQHYGVLSVYRGRLAHGQKDPGLLKWDWWICIGVSGIFSIVIEYLNGDLGQLQLFSAQPTALTSGFAASLLWLRPLLSALVLGFWGLTVGLYLQKRQGIARLLYFSTLCYMTLVSFYVDPFLYFSIVQIQHWLVSLGLTTHMAENARLGPQSRWYAPWARINATAWGPLLVLVLLSICLTPFLEADYFIAQGFSSDGLVVQHFLDHFNGSGWIWFFGGLAFFSSFLHYIYDRGVFRFSDPLTRKAAIGLLRPRADS
ncbi:MAG: hypothetical protein ACAI44_11055 [Candidatus Sericytochromatia bacterium]